MEKHFLSMAEIAGAGAKSNPRNHSSGTVGTTMWSPTDLNSRSSCPHCEIKMQHTAPLIENCAQIWGPIFGCALYAAETAVCDAWCEDEDVRETTSKHLCCTPCPALRQGMLLSGAAPPMPQMFGNAGSALPYHPRQSPCDARYCCVY